jgi:hypothetical protein
MNNIKRGNLNYDQSGRAYPDNHEVNENWNCIWENNGKYYKLVGDDYHKEWEEVDIFNQIIDEAYENYENKIKLQNNWEVTLRVMDINTIGQQELLSQEEFINKCKTDPEFSEKWGFKIEERELSLEERLKIADKFNPLIREDCLTKTHHPDETDELKLVYRHEWLDSLGSNVVPQRKLITLTYNNETVEVYE